MAPSEVTQLEERMVEEVMAHEHLYIPSHKDYKNGQTTLTSWREIAGNVGLSVKDCKEKWRTMRDRFMRIKKKVTSEKDKIRSGDAGGKKVPDFYTLMSFLEPHVKHRDTSSDFEKVSPAADAQADASATADATPPARLPSASSCALAESALLPSDPETQTAEGRPLELEEGDTIADITTESSIQLPTTSPARHLPSTCHVRKTKRTLTELESSLQSKVAKLEERRAMLQQQQQQSRQQQSTTTTTPTANRNHREEDDEVDRFGQMVGDMMRRLPEDLRPETMFEVHKVLYEAQQKAKQLAASAAQQVS